MPASAVARRTPAITGMSGTILGARGETEEDIAGRLDRSGYADGRDIQCEDVLRTFGPAIATLDTIGVREVTANSYFFAGGAILLSEGLASEGLAASAGLASLAASAGWSSRSTLASARSLAT